LFFLGSRLRGNDEFNSLRAPPKFNQPLLWLILPLALVLAPHAFGLPLWISLSWLVFALASLRAATQKQAWPRWLKMFLTLAGVAGVLLQYGTVIGPQGGVALLVFLSGAKLLETHTPRDRLGLLFVGCFLLVAYFLNSQSMALAAYMILAAIALVAAMIANAQPAPDPRATLGLATRLLLQALPLALLLFVLFPRLQGPLWGLPQQAAAQTGISDRMSPGDFSQLSQSDEIAFRVEFANEVASEYANKSPDPSALYWRGPVLWDFDGRTWQTRLTVPPNPIRAEGLGQPVSYTITLEPHQQRWLFLLGLPEKLPQIESSLGPDLQWLAKAPVTQRMRYSVDADLDYRLDPAGLSAASRARTLALPEGNPQARELAEQWTARSRNDRAIVEQALAHFRGEAFFYTLNPPLLGESSVDDFLFRTRRGFCEHYASAFVFLMRAAGVPARVVTGYQGGERNPLGNYWIVRQRDAHAWAEVWLVNQGWTRIDPTAAVAPDRVERGLNAALPASERRAGLMTLDAAWLMPMRLTWDLLNNQWNQWVLGYNQDRQREFLARLNPFLATWQGMAWGLAAAGGVLLLMMTVLILPRLAKSNTDPASRLYARFCQRLSRRGIVRGVAEGPADFAARAAGLRPDQADAIHEITRLYLALRYGGAAADRLAELNRAVGEFRPKRIHLASEAS
jgi:transglutaminase-like putative cysteine protease